MSELVNKDSSFPTGNRKRREKAEGARGRWRCEENKKSTKRIKNVTSVQLSERAASESEERRLA